MYINKYFGMALLGVMVCMLGLMAFMVINDRNQPAHAQRGGDIQMIAMQVAPNTDGLAMYADGKLVVYRVWNGTNLIPVSGRVVLYDFEILNKLNTMSFSNISPTNENYSDPSKLKKACEKE